MERYKNLSGDSGILEYEIVKEGIKIKFKSGATYLYTYESAGASNIELMRQLALRGKGLSSFISRTVKAGYAYMSST
jgi:hypothetical protein